MYRLCFKGKLSPDLLYHFGMVDNLVWNNIWKLPHKYLITNKIKEISLKLIYKYYPCNYYLVNRFNYDIDNFFLIFCDLHD